MPPKLINVNANMLVATATRESIPNWNIAGTVMIDVLPVITLTLLVAKKIAISASKRTPVTASILALAAETKVQYGECREPIPFAWPFFRRGRPMLASPDLGTGLP